MLYPLSYERSRLRTGSLRTPVAERHPRFEGAWPPRSECPGAPAGKRVELVRRRDVRPCVEELLGRRDAHLGQEVLAHVEVDGEHAVAAPVVHARVELALAGGDGDGVVLEVV